MKIIKLKDLLLEQGYDPLNPPPLPPVDPIEVDPEEEEAEEVDDKIDRDQEDRTTSSTKYKLDKVTAAGIYDPGFDPTDVFYGRVNDHYITYLRFELKNIKTKKVETRSIGKAAVYYKKSGGALKLQYFNDYSGNSLYTIPIPHNHDTGHNGSWIASWAGTQYYDDRYYKNVLGQDGNVLSYSVPTSKNLAALRNKIKSGEVYIVDMANQDPKHSEAEFIEDGTSTMHDGEDVHNAKTWVD